MTEVEPMIDDPLNLSMFRAYDIRTPSSLLTAELAQRLARAEACYFRDVLGAPGVITSRRPENHTFSQARRSERLPSGCATYLFE